MRSRKNKAEILIIFTAYFGFGACLCTNVIGVVGSLKVLGHGLARYFMEFLLYSSILYFYKDSNKINASYLVMVFPVWHP